MENQIRLHLQEPAQLEKLYRSNKTSFKDAFSRLYPELKGNLLADFWQERLVYEKEEINWGNRKELIVVILLSLLAGLIAKLPAIFIISDDFFYPRNIGFTVFPALAAYFAWKQKLSIGRILFIVGAMLTGALFINAFPGTDYGDTLILSCIHLAIFLWAVLGVAFTGQANNVMEKRLDYLKFNGDLAVMTALILIAGAIASRITLGLFSVIGWSIETFYFKNVIIFGLPIAPILGTYLIQANPQLVGKVSPVIAKIFSPLVLVMLLVYLGAMAFSGKDPYTDREFLIVFNVLLIGVMAIIFFSVAETQGTTKSRIENWILLLLSIVTIIVNGIALSAIVFRISEWGITPNRTAVLGSNILMLINLVLVTIKLFKAKTDNANLANVGKSIAYYLPVYAAWAIIVTFLFPFIFGFQ